MQQIPTFVNPLCTKALNADSRNCQEYLDNLLRYVQLLTDEYGGDFDIVSSAAILNSIHEPLQDTQLDPTKSQDLYQKILTEIDFPKSKVDEVLEALKYCRTPGKNRGTLEAMIVSDSAFLAKQGAWSIFRSVTNPFSDGNCKDRLIDELNESISKTNDLAFEASRRTAISELKIMNLFVALLVKPPELEKGYEGKYIVLEGNSGVGKDTQAELLEQKLISLGHASQKVNEPSKYFRDIDEFWENEFNERLKDNGSLFRRFIIIADRAELMKKTVVPALKNGTTIISARNYLSMLVYQCKDEVDLISTAFLHQFVPEPDLIILYDTSEDVCLQRIEERQGEHGLFDQIEELRKYRPKYRKIAKSPYVGSPVETIDATDGIQDVATLTWRAICKHFPELTA